MGWEWRVAKSVGGTHKTPKAVFQKLKWNHRGSGIPKAQPTCIQKSELRPLSILGVGGFTD